ncbi:MAG: ADP-ribosylglycohydrolase family protein [Rhodocyclaceae bacterium]|nr:ADP-ribosylglycohydrolase family protein [Rhodocyclaceae bacterium]MCA3081282.1 ADP-ribosylglycohydrolase family protein [Rhodocyclaceae bacterium]
MISEHTLALPTAAQRAKFRGCLLGGAIGDALGAPVEFMRLSAIHDKFGPQGVTKFEPAYGGIGRITDDTQMTLFTAEGLLRGYVRGCYKGISSLVGTTANAYQRWLKTQGDDVEVQVAEPDGWLFTHKELHKRRAPGNTCISSLQLMDQIGRPAQNDSKGCGAVMRVAPVGLFRASGGREADFDVTFQLAADIGALTHGHPTGYLTAGVFAVLIEVLSRGLPLHLALEFAKMCLRKKEGYQETMFAIELAERLAKSKAIPAKAICEIGEGWIAEESLAISIYCALTARTFESAVLNSVNHDGDSDSTGALTGNLMGAALGFEQIPADWRSQVELKDVAIEIADDLLDFPTWEIGEYITRTMESEAIWTKYPGH